METLWLSLLNTDDIVSLMARWFIMSYHEPCLNLWYSLPLLSVANPKRALCMKVASFSAIRRQINSGRLFRKKQQGCVSEARRSNKLSVMAPEGLCCWEWSCATNESRSPLPPRSFIMAFGRTEWAPWCFCVALKSTCSLVTGNVSRAILNSSWITASEFQIPQMLSCRCKSHYQKKIALYHRGTKKIATAISLQTLVASLLTPLGFSFDCYACSAFTKCCHTMFRDAVTIVQQAVRQQILVYSHLLSVYSGNTPLQRRVTGSLSINLHSFCFVAGGSSLLRD